MTIYRKFLALALVVAGWSEIILGGGPPGVGWLVLVGLLYIAAQLLSRALECRRGSFAAQFLWLVPNGFGVALSMFDAQSVASFAPVLLLFSCAVCVRFTLSPPKSILELADLGGPIAKAWWGGWGRLPTALEGAQLSPHAGGNRSMARGLLLAFPLLLIFGALFCAADAEFGDALQALLAYISLERLLPAGRWLLYTLLWSTLFLGLAFSQRQPQKAEVEQGTDGGAWTVALSLVNLLFAGFLAVQAPRLFVHGIAAGRLATYAREGFFQLLLCTVLVYALVRFIYSRYLGPSRQGSLNLLCTVLLIQTIGVAASALHRLSLYAAEFGLSVLRIYAALGIIAFSLLLLILLGACLLRPRQKQLQVGLNLVGTLVLLATSLTNVDGWVASSHINRALNQVRPLDVAYLSGLSADAVPSLLEGVKSGVPKLREDSLLILKALHREPSQAFYQWNYHRAKADKLLQLEEPKL